MVGYIHRGEAIRGEGRRSGLAAASYRVKQFQEKPDAATAAKYLASGEYYWNSGIFVWRASTILDALRARQPEMLKHLETIVAAGGTPERQAVFGGGVAAIKPVSVDYAVVEQAAEV